MMQVGEETGKTTEILQKTADFLEEEVSNTTKNLSSLIEPLIILLVGVMVGIFAISIIQPIYQMMGAL
jgi:type II secretory pathway component PulF